MKPVNCTVKDDPANGSYGDCVRACVASILEMESDQVPHFYANGPAEDLEAFDGLRVWLTAHDRIPAYFPINGSKSLDWVIGYVGGAYNNAPFILYCQSGGADHCIAVDEKGEIHNPAWYKAPIDGPHSSGVWIVIILARI